MMYARIENGTVAAYPVDLQIECPATSFPWDWPGGVLHGVEYTRVVPVDVPQVDHTKNFVEGSPALIAGVWTQTWVVVDASPEEVAQRLAAMRATMSVSPLQIRRALRRRGLFEAVVAFIASASDDVRDAWEYALRIDRADPLIAGAAQALGATDADVDELFRLAATL